MMETKIKLAVLLLGIIFTGLTAGLCFTWSNAVTTGIGLLDDLPFLRSFQAMNRAIVNGKFLIVFFSPALLLFINTYLFKNSGVSFWLLLAAAVLFFVGIGLVTIFRNVPLNEILDKSNLSTLTETELGALRKKFEQPWNRWHTVRTVTSFLAFVLLLLGFIYTK